MLMNQSVSWLNCVLNFLILDLLFVGWIFILLFFFFCSFEYKNEAGGDPPDKPADIDDDGNAPKSYSIPVYSTHQLVIENVAFYMEEFRIGRPRNADTTNKHVETPPAAEQFYSTMSELPDIQLTNKHLGNDFRLKSIYLNSIQEIKLTIRKISENRVKFG